MPQKPSFLYYTPEMGFCKEGKEIFCGEFLEVSAKSYKMK